MTQQPTRFNSFAAALAKLFARSAAASSTNQQADKKGDREVVTLSTRQRELMGQADRDLRYQKQLALVLMGAIVAFLALIYLPSARRLQTLAQKISTSTATLDAQRQQLAQLPVVKTAADELDRHLDAFKPIPQGDEQFKFVGQISDNAENLQLENFSWMRNQKQIESSSLHRLPIRISFASDFDSAFTFLRHLEEMPRLLRITDLTMFEMPPSKANARPMVNVQLTVNLFYQPLDHAVASADRSSVLSGR